MRKKILSHLKLLIYNQKKFWNKYLLKHFRKSFVNIDLIPPEKWYLGKKDFIKNYNEIYKYHEVFPEESFEAKPPIHIESKIDDKYYKKNISFEADYILDIPNAKVIGQDGVVITADNRLLNDVNLLYSIYSNPEEHEIFSYFKLPELKQINGTVAVLTSLWSNCFYHWMFDILPKFHMLEKAGIKPDYYVLDMENKAFQKFSLEKLNIDEKKIITTSKELHIKADNIIVPNIPAYTDCKPWMADFLKNSFLTKTTTNKNKIFINRKQTSSRRIVNNNEVIDILNKYGFDEIFLEDLNLSEQAEVINSAEVIIALHGSGLTNLVFAEQGTKVIEIFSPIMNVGCYWTLCNVLGLKNYQFIATNADKNININGIKYSNQDIIIDIVKLGKLINLALKD